MKTNYIFLLAIILCMAGCKKGDKPADTVVALTQGDQQEKVKAACPVIDKIFHDHFEKNHFPGLAFGVIMDGRLVFANSFGVANTALKIPATTSTNFRIASMSKSFTALSILKLRDEGKLSLQDAASKYIPELAKVSSLRQGACKAACETGRQRARRHRSIQSQGRRDFASSHH